MITRFQANDFQCHQDQDIRLDTITALVGDSDAGKSALIRALRWLCLNKPRGDSFLRHGAKGLRVRAKVDGHTVLRQRSDTENTYEVDGTVYRAFGSIVPPVIQQLLQVNDLNFQGQHESAFWFGLTPGELAHQLNKLVDLDIIDELLRRWASKLRECQAESKVIEERLTEAKSQAASLTYVKSMDRDLRALEKAGEEADKLRKQCTRLDALVVDLRALQAKQTRSRAVLAKATARVKELDGLRAEVAELKGDIAALEGMIESHQTNQHRVEELRDRLVKAEEQLRRECGGVCPVCGGELK